MSNLTARKGKKGTTYYLRYSYSEHSYNGKKTFKVKSIKAGDSKSEALNFQRQFDKQYRGNRDSFNQLESKKLFDYIQNEFLPWSETHKSLNTHEITKRSLIYWMNFLGDIYLSEINVKRVEQYIIMRSKKASNRTVNIDLTYLSQALKKAVQYGYLSKNIMMHVQRLKESTGKLRYFTTEEVQTILSTANPYIERFITTGLLTGMRLSEMMNLQLPQIDMNKKIIHIINTDEFKTKNRKNRDVPIPPQLMEKLPEYMNTWVCPNNMETHQRTTEQRRFLFCDENGYRMKTFRKAYGRHLERLGITGATIHTMRHTYASHLVMNNVNIRTVQELLGHHSIKVTEKYAHLSDNHKMEAVNLLSY